MTLRLEGKIGGREFAIRSDEDGQPKKFVCLACRSETKPKAISFERHKCRGSAIAPAEEVPPQTEDDTDETR